MQHSSECNPFDLPFPPTLHHQPNRRHAALLCTQPPRDNDRDNVQHPPKETRYANQNSLKPCKTAPSAEVDAAVLGWPEAATTPDGTGVVRCGRAAGGDAARLTIMWSQDLGQNIRTGHRWGSRRKALVLGWAAMTVAQPEPCTQQPCCLDGDPSNTNWTVCRPGFECEQCAINQPRPRQYRRCCLLLTRGQHAHTCRIWPGMSSHSTILLSPSQPHSALPPLVAQPPLSPSPNVDFGLLEKTLSSGLPLPNGH